MGPPPQLCLCADSGTGLSRLRKWISANPTLLTRTCLIVISGLPSNRTHLTQPGSSVDMAEDLSRLAWCSIKIVGTMIKAGFCARTLVLSFRVFTPILSEMKLLFCMAAMGFASAAVLAAPLDLSHAKIVVLNPQQRTAAKAAAMLRDEVEKRTRITLAIVAAVPEGEEPLILIGTAQDLASHSFRAPADNEVPAKPDACTLWIDNSRGQGPAICAAGYDGRATVFAVGRLLRLL